MLVVLSLIAVALSSASLKNDFRAFAETGCTVQGRFLGYWQEHGGLAQFGYPLSEALNDQSSLNSKVYLTQYFERAVFELHPENQPPNDVQLSLLGMQSYQQKYPQGASNQRTSSDQPYYFAQSGKTLGGKFRAYWEAHGGLDVQGYPISDEFSEIAADGKSYQVQYFERAVFEYHPEYAGSGYEVLLSQLGSTHYAARVGTINLHALDMVSPDEGWAVGDKGAILHYQAKRWFLAARAGGNLDTVSLGTKDEGWAGGSLSNLVHYHDGQWQEDKDVHFFTSQVKMISANQAWAVAIGDRGGPAYYSDGTWQFQHYYLDLPISLAGRIDMLSDNEGWIVDYSAFSHYSGTGKWTRVQSLGPRASVLPIFHGIKLISNVDGWAVGGSNTPGTSGSYSVIYHYDGNSWQPVPDNFPVFLNNVDGVAGDNLWAVGGLGVIIHYDGQHWMQYPSPTKSALNGIKMTSANEGWAVGDAGTILHYQNGVWSAYNF